MSRRGGSVLGLGALGRRRLAEVLVGGRGALAIPVLGAVVLVLYPVLSGSNQYWIHELTMIGIYTLVVSGVNLTLGYAGEVQFGQVFMFALGAYLTAVLAIHGLNDLLLLIPIGGIAAALVGAAVALPALRVGGWSLAMASFFLVITIPDLLSLFQSQTGGVLGLANIPIPKLLGTSQGTTAMFEVTVVMTILWLAVYRNLVTSRYGVIFRILRESPVQLASLGFSGRRLKAVAYAFGAFPAGVAGCLFGLVSAYLTPDSFGLTLTIGLVAASVLGGVESVYGALIGAAILQLGPQSSLSVQQYAPIAYGVFLIIAAVVFRLGVAGAGRRLALRGAHWLSPATRAYVPGSLSDKAAVDGKPIASEDITSPEVLKRRPGRTLTVTSVSKAFGGVQALDGVSLTIEPGLVTGLIGSNGSGKTTLLNVICGYAVPDAGSVALGEIALVGQSPHQIAHARIARTFQTPSVPRGVSIVDVVASGRFREDHLGIIASIFRVPRYWRCKRQDRTEALRYLGLVNLADRSDEEASTVSLGTRRLVEVARAMCAEPDVLLLDEPASGLSDAEVERLGRVIRLAAAANIAVVLIEHNFRFVASVSDSAHVLHVGRRIASGPTDELARNPEVVASYLGRSAAELPAGEPVGSLLARPRGGGSPS